MLLSKCAVCDSKRQKFIKEQEASWLLGILGIKTPLIEILLVGPLLFQRYKMNEIVNNFLLAGDKFNHLQQTKKEYKNFKKQKVRDIFIKTNQTKIFFNMTLLLMKHLTRRTAPDKILRDKTFNPYLEGGFYSSPLPPVGSPLITQKR